MNGISSGIGYVFVATGLVESGHDEQAEEGITETRAFTWGEIMNMIKTGEIIDGLSIVALMKYYAKTEDSQ